MFITPDQGESVPYARLLCFLKIISLSTKIPSIRAAAAGAVPLFDVIEKQGMGIKGTLNGPWGAL